MPLPLCHFMLSIERKPGSIFGDYVFYTHISKFEQKYAAANTSLSLLRRKQWYGNLISDEEKGFAAVC